MELMKLESSRDMLALAATYQDAYTYQVRHFIKWARANGKTIDQEGITDYFRALNESGYTAATIRNKRSAVKRRVRQLFHDAPIDARMKIDRVLNDLEHDADTKAPKVNTNEITPDRVLTLQDYRAILDACRSARQRAFIMFLYSTGCRVSEMTGIRLEQCDVMGATVKIRVMGKGKKERFVRIPSDLFNQVRGIFNGKTYLFETGSGRQYAREYVSSQIKKIGKIIGREISAHSLRHSFATRKVQQLPGKLDAVSRYLGHSSPSITLAMYCHSSMTDAELYDDLAAAI